MSGIVATTHPTLHVPGVKGIIYLSSCVGHTPRCDGHSSQTKRLFPREAAGADSGFLKEREGDGAHTRTHDTQAQTEGTNDNMPLSPRAMQRREQPPRKKSEGDPKARLQVENRGMLPIDVQSSEEEDEDNDGEKKKKDHAKHRHFRKQ